MAVALTQPIVIEDRAFDFGCSDYICPPGKPGLIVRGRGRPSNAKFWRRDGDRGTAPCVLVEDGYRAHLSFIIALYGQFGHWLMRSEGTRMLDCEGQYSDLDGGKETDNCRDTLWERGFYTHNGQSPTQKGDGLDSYDGGGSSAYAWVVCDDNDGCGITYKTAKNKADGSGNPQAGYQSDVEFVHVRCRRNLYGLNLEGQQETASTTYSAADHDARPLAARVSIEGGVFNDNAHDGITIWARDWSAIGGQTNRNGRAGFKIGRTARDWALIGWQAIGNGRNVLGSNVDGPASGTTGQRPSNIWVLGKRGAIIAPILRGADVPDAWDDADLDAATPTARDGIWFAIDADDVDVQFPVGSRHLRSTIRNDASGTIRVNGEVLAYQGQL